MTQGMLKYTYNMAAGTNTLQLYTSGKPLHCSCILQDNPVMLSGSILRHCAIGSWLKHCATVQLVQ
jgi:hypothetical protein